MWLKMFVIAATVDGTYTTKYMKSLFEFRNVTKRWNLGFFENVVWTNTNDRGVSILIL